MCVERFFLLSLISSQRSPPSSRPHPSGQMTPSSGGVSQPTGPSITRMVPNFNDLRTYAMLCYAMLCSAMHGRYHMDTSKNPYRNEPVAWHLLLGVQL